MRHRFTTILTFAILLLSQTLLVHAQATNPTAQPEQRFIQNWAEEVIFPSAVRFTVSVALTPSQVTAATLTIKPDTGEPILIPLDLSKTIITGGDSSGIALLWTLPTDNPPALFKDITFDWEVTSAEGKTATIEDHFTFQDQRVRWLRDLPITDTFKLTIPNGKATSNTPTPAYTRTGLDNLTANLQQEAKLLATNLGSSPTFNILVYDTTRLPICTKNDKGQSVAVGAVSNVEVACDPKLAEKIFSASGYDTLKLKSTSLGDIQTAVSNSIVQQSYSAAWAGKNIPQWFQAGLTEFYSPESKAELNASALVAARSNSLLPLDVMAKAPPANGELWQSESYGLVVYIASQIGVDGLFKLASNAGTAASFEEAYQTATGKPISTLLGSFGRWLVSDAAEGAFTFTVYQAATPSPTPSRTATITPTPTVTNTATETPTATVTGVLSATPRATHTLTPTPMQGTATNTPRPAGSLNTPVPTPVPTSSAQVAENSNLRIGIAILIVGLIIVIVAGFILYRPRR